MEKEKMDRISELTRLSRERELTEDEKTERAALRAEYLKDWRESTINVLENVYRGRKGQQAKARQEVKKTPQAMPETAALRGFYCFS